MCNIRSYLYRVDWMIRDGQYNNKKKKQKKKIEEWKDEEILLPPW
jgi:hypothetical protein